MSFSFFETFYILHYEDKSVVISLQWTFKMPQLYKIEIAENAPWILLMYADSYCEEKTAEKIFILYLCDLICLFLCETWMVLWEELLNLMAVLL